MKTITFYSYKGGVGRTLALANIASRLSEFNKKVCILDFDLEAPGLPYKFKDRNEIIHFEIKNGIVDYIDEFLMTDTVPKSISDFVTKIQFGSKRKTSIDLIAAGNPDNPTYWHKLAKLNWNDLFYKEDSEGVPFFLDLKAKIQEELKPDFLLIDSRTGITEISGISISLYADTVVIVSANNEENLSGSKRIIETLNRPENNVLGKPLEKIFVLSRIPFPNSPEERERENRILKDVYTKISIPKENILLIHTDRELEIKESIRSLHQNRNSIPVAEDYLQLFLKLNLLNDSETERFNRLKEAEILYEKHLTVNSSFEKIQLLTDAIALVNDKEEYYFHRALEYSKLKNFDQAINDLTKVIELNSSNAAAYFNISIISLTEKQYSKAIDNIEKATELDSKNVVFQNVLGIIYNEIGNLDEALKIFDYCLKLNPNFIEVYNEIGNVYRQKKEYTLAFENIYKCLELSPQFGFAFSTLAEIQAEVGNINEFYKNFELGFSFGCPIDEFILKDEVYKPFFKEDRFRKIIKKYKPDFNLALLDKI